MPRVKVPRFYNLALAKWGFPSNPHAPAKAVAVRKFATGHGAIVQQKAGAGASQLQDCRGRKAPISGQSIRALASAERGSLFAAAPYLKAMRRGMHVDSAALQRAVAAAGRAAPAPSFAARPVWGGSPAQAAHEASPQTTRQAAARQRLAQSPLYAYAQLGPGSRGVRRPAVAAQGRQQQSAAKGRLTRREREGLLQYAALGAQARGGASFGGVRKASHAAAAKGRSGLRA